MPANSGNPTTPFINGWRLALWSVAVAILLLPLVAMQFTDVVAWTGADFAVFGAMLFFAGGAFELAARVSALPAYRAGAAVAIGTGFLLLWINLAVGIIGSEDNPANLLYGVVLLIAIASSAIARLRPAGMFRAMTVTAVSQASVPAIVVLAGRGPEDKLWILTVAILTVFFAGAWIFAAMLFRRAIVEYDVAS